METPLVDEAAITPVMTSIEPLTRRQRFGRFVAGLPWGVIGVVGVILAIGLGVMILLRGGAAALPVTPTPAPTKLSPTHTPTIAPTAPPTPTKPPPTPIPPTPTLAPRAEVVVQSGDTCSSIALKYKVDVDELIRYNNLDSGCLINIGNSIKIPPVLPTAGPTPTTDPNVTVVPLAPTSTLPPELIYEVRSGDVCGTIAEKFRIPVAQIISQNKLDVDCTIRVGQKLTLKFGAASAAPAATNTPYVAMTPTPRVGYSAPIALSPADGAVFTESVDVVTLQWLTVGMLKEDEWYVVHVQPSGAISVPLFETKGTSIRLTRDLLGKEQERSVAWWVEVKRVAPQTGNPGAPTPDAFSAGRAYVTLSPPSAARRFTWRQILATAVPR